MASDSLYEDGSAAPKASTKKADVTGQDTLLNRLRETISKKVERPMVLVEVPDRDGVYIRISPNISQNQMRSWRRNAGEDTKSGLDPTKFSAYVIGHTTVGFEIEGEEVLDADGLSMNFASGEILNMTGADRPVPDAVRAFFGTDPHLEAAALAILEAAGYGDTVETVDPTKKSSTN